MPPTNVTKTELQGQISPDQNSITILAPAKINLFLKVLGPRADGYHDIFSWFQTISLCDRLEITKINPGKIEITTDAENIPTGPDNLIYKAAELFMKETGCRCGFRIKLDKKIPVSAGLGGGSSDAAAFIKAANKLLQTGLTRSDRARIGLEIGSDLPFFFGTGQAEVTGRGEFIADTRFPIDYRLILVTPPLEIRAAEAYQKWKMGLTDPIHDIRFRCRSVQANIREIYPEEKRENQEDNAGNRAEELGANFKLSDKFWSLENRFSLEKLVEIITGLENDLEQELTDSYPVLKEIRNRLKKDGVKMVRMTGSGPTMFALFTESTRLEKTLIKSLEGYRWDVACAHPVVLPA